MNESMMNEPTMNESNSACGRADEVLAEYFLRIDRGEVIDFGEFVDQHPDVAEELRAYHDDLDALRSLVDTQVPTGHRTPRARSPSVPSQAIRRFGDYDLLEELGRGGMGVVYKARQGSLNRTVAVKMILAGRLAGTSEVERFRREAEAVANLQHSRIIAVHEVGEHLGQHYFSMDYIEGCSLADLVRENPLPSRNAATYLMKVAQTVHYAHQKGIIHRDLKPSNILIDRQDEPYVSDFGLAKRVGGESDLTCTEPPLGTASYLPPEQTGGRLAEVGPGSDVYCLGATLYHLVTGRAPFRAETRSATVELVKHSEPVPPRMLNPLIPRDLETICLKCLEKAPARRYASAQDLADELDRFLTNRPILARPVSRVEKCIRWVQRNPWVAALAALVCLSLLAFFVATIAGYVSTAAALSVAREETARAEEERSRAERESYVSQIGLAYQKWLNGEVSMAENTLNASPRDQRHWEWGYLKRLCNSELFTIHVPPYQVDFVVSPDGTRIASSCGLWDATTGRRVIGFQSIPESCRGVAFSGDGKWIAVGGDSTSVWNTDDGKLHATIPASAQLIAMSPSGDDCRGFKQPSLPGGHIIRKEAPCHYNSRC